MSKQETMTNNEISDLVAEIAGKIRFELDDNAHRDTLSRGDALRALAHVNKHLYEMAVNEGGREGVKQHCIDAIGWLAIFYKIRKEPYGEY